MNLLKNIKDILQVVGMFVLLVVPFLLAKLWFWCWFWVYILLGFAIFEVVTYLSTGRTLSQRFGDYRRIKPTEGNLILISMILGWLCLIWHLI